MNNQPEQPPIKTPSLDYERIILPTNFIQRNKLFIVPQEKIVEEFERIQAQETFLDFRTEVLIEFLSFDSAKPFLKPEAIEEYERGEKQWQELPSIETAAQNFLDYMNFAWGKATDERGISAGRSIQKLGAMLLVMGRPDLSNLINQDRLYNPYGAPALVAVCNEMGISVPQDVIEFSKEPQ